MESLHGIEHGPLHIGNSFVAWSVCRTNGNRTRIYPYCMSWLIESHSIWWDMLLNLDVEKDGLGSASNEFVRLCFLPMGAFTLCKEWMRVKWWKGGSEGWERELWLVCKNESIKLHICVCVKQINKWYKQSYLTGILHCNRKNILIGKTSIILSIGSWITLHPYKGMSFKWK